MTTTHVADTQRHHRLGPLDRASATALVDAVSGPHTIVGLGEDCFVCRNPLEPGEVYQYVSDDEHRAANESCVDDQRGI